MLFLFPLSHFFIFFFVIFIFIFFSSLDNLAEDFDADLSRAQSSPQLAPIKPPLKPKKPPKKPLRKSKMKKTEKSPGPLNLNFVKIITKIISDSASLPNVIEPAVPKATNRSNYSMIRVDHEGNIKDETYNKLLLDL